MKNFDAACLKYRAGQGEGVTIMTVKGKRILITGGAGGLGSGMAKFLAKEGAVIFILDLPGAAIAGNQLVSEIEAGGGRAYFKPIDGTREDDWERVTGEVIQKEGRIDVLINNAGITIPKAIEDMSMAEWMRIMEVNVGAVFLGIKYVLPHMRRQGGGSIINISSQCGLIGHRYSAEAYTASKGAVTLLTKSVAVRYGKDKIRCNAICPSTAATPLVMELLEDPVFSAERCGEVPLGRLCTAKDIACAAFYLASDEASYINGVALPVDGGSTAD